MRSYRIEATKLSHFRAQRMLGVKGRMHRKGGGGNSIVAAASVI